MLKLWAVPLAIGLGLLPSAPVTQAQAPLNPTLRVGIVQRFGQQPSDRLQIAASPQRSLIVRFTAAGEPRQFRVQRLTVVIAPEPLAVPEQRSRLVISQHRSFESAEASAEQWRAKGFDVEIAQPQGWEVWLKPAPDLPDAALPSLLQRLRSEGAEAAVLRSETRTTRPQLVWQLGEQRFQGDRLEIESNGPITVAGVPYPGRLTLQPNAYGDFTLVNTVAIEDYLSGVVPHEIGAGAPAQAIAAQAILARTYALRNVRRFQIDNYELCADVQCQVYRGWESRVPTVEQAIRQTRGLVLSYDNQLIDAVYSSTTGGVTAAFEDAWLGQERTYLQPRLDAVRPLWNLQARPLNQEANLKSFLQLREGFNETGQPRFRWQRRRSLVEIQADLKTYLRDRRDPRAEFQQIQSVTISQRSPSGRVLEVTVQSDRGPIVIGRDEVRRAFAGLFSTLFYLEPERDSSGRLLAYRFVGGGFGHGVGLSQTGAMGLARQGWNYDRILKFYYPQTQLEPLHPAMLQATNQPAP
ncbi:SpoIID/LytB domain-containing protein [Synechococcus elongatus IITB7]|uniref:SpoIID/LytB domain-containing protein n=1 Tax=Synechococcus elongatus TaxID=32046 RepID=UPI0030D1C746